MGETQEDVTEAFATALGYQAFNSIAEPSCVVGEDGQILATNAAWNVLSHENNRDSIALGAGSNYFQNGAITGCDQSDAAALLTGIEDVLAGRTKSASRVYSSNSHTTRRWFCAQISRLIGPGPSRAVIVHEDMTLLEGGSNFDGLTGLPNRHLFRDRLAQAIAQAKRNNRIAATLNVSLNRFKLVNQTLGHLAGDELLALVSRRIAGALRASDSIGRLEGDVFGVVLPDLHQSHDAIVATQTLLLSLDKPFAVQGENVFVTANVGIASFPENGEDPDALLVNADTAMQRVKQREGSGYEFYTEQMNARNIERLRLESELREAAERKEFVLFYQPKVEVATGRISGAECLIRWKHPQRGLVFPGEFINVLEETSLIVQVGSWYFKKRASKWRAGPALGSQSPKISVNVSPRQFLRRDFAAHVSDIISASGANPDRIELEITETMLMTDPEHAVCELAKLKRLGVGLSVDDFGTGYSSLAYLKRFPLDTLKIDIAFIRDTCTDPDSAAITLAIINLAHNLRLKVVAEGVETAPQFNFLASHGLRSAQGYLFSKPVAVPTLEHMLRNDIRLNVPRTHRSVQPTLLIVDRSEADAQKAVNILDEEGYRIFVAEQPTSALQLLSEVEVQIIIAGSEFNNMSGIEFLSQVRQMYPSIDRVIALDTGDPQAIVAAVNAAGIHKFLFKNWSDQRIQETVSSGVRGETARDTRIIFRIFTHVACRI